MWTLPYKKKVISSNPLHVNIKCHHDDQSFRNKCYAAVRLLLDGDQQERPLSDFIVMFNDKYNENLNERIIKAMKHAIEVTNLKWLNQKNQQTNSVIYNALYSYISHTDLLRKWYKVCHRHKTNTFCSWIDWGDWNARPSENARFVQFTEAII